MLNSDLAKYGASSAMYVTVLLDVTNVNDCLLHYHSLHTIVVSIMKNSHQLRC